MKKLLPILSLLSLLLIAAGQGCKQFSLNTDDLELSVDMNIIKTNVTIRFLDAATDELIGFDNDNRIRVTVHGPDSLNVLTTSGERKPQYFSAAGYLSLGLDPYKAKPTADDPVDFTLVAQLPGYISTSLPVTLVSEGGFDFIVRMVNEGDPPDGVAIKSEENAGTATGGDLEEDIKINTDNKEVDITISKGTTLKDEEGQPLEGELSVTMAHFNPTEQDALSAFPGGLNVKVKNESENEDAGVFVSAGFVSIDITDQNGKKAALFEGGGLNLNAQIDTKVLNPETGQPVQAGDIIPFWSYNDETGEWKFERNIQVEASPMGLQVSTRLPHLSWWNIDWFDAACAFVEIYFTTDQADKTGATGWGYGLRWIAQLVGGDASYQSEGYFAGFPELTGIMSVLNTERLQSVPYNKQIQITFFAEGEHPLWQTPDPITYDFCAESPVEVPLTPNASTGGGSDLLTITFTVSIYCTDLGTSANIPDNTLLRYRKKGTSTWTTISASSNQVTIGGLEQNTVYEVQALYDGAWIPSPAFEYLVEPSTETNLSKTLTFNLNCGG